MSIVGLDDAADQWMAHHVLVQEIGECEAAHVPQDLARLDQPTALAARQVDLSHIPGHHGA